MFSPTGSPGEEGTTAPGASASVTPVLGGFAPLQLPGAAGVAQAAAGASGRPPVPNPGGGTGALRLRGVGSAEGEAAGR